MQTLRRERIQKFFEILMEKQAMPNWPVIEYDNMIAWRKELAAALADAAESRTERKTDEEGGEYNVELMRGDYNDYPEHLREYARVLRDTWKFTLPPKTKGKSEKGRYGFFIQEMESIRQACAEFGTDVLLKVHEEWRAKFKDGIAPYTVARPSSLVNVCAGKARELREKHTVKVDDRRHKL